MMHSHFQKSYSSRHRKMLFFLFYYEKHEELALLFLTQQ